MIRGIQVMSIPISLYLVPGILSGRIRPCPTAPCHHDTIAEWFWLSYSKIDLI